MGWTQADIDKLQAKKAPELNAKAKVRAKALKRMAAEQAERLFAEVCTKAGLPTPVSEYRFHKTRKWRIDYFFRRGDLKVGLEVEGGVWIGGRHTRGKGFLGDIEKYNAAAIEGITVLRTTPSQLYTQGVADVVRWFENQEI